MSKSGSERSAARWLSRRFAFKLHGWSGFLLSILLFTICFSGTLAVVGNEIDWLLNPALRAPARSSSIEWSAIHRNVQALHPEAQILWLQAPIEPGFAVEVVLQRHDLNQFWRVYANPYSAEIQGQASWLTAQRLLRNLHMYLFLPGSGKYVVTFFGLTMLVSMVTGIIVYRKWWRGFFIFDRSRGSRILWGSAHKLLGVWSLWFVAVIAITGAWYFVEELMFDFTNFRYTSTPRLDSDQLRSYGPAVPLADLDAIVARSRQEVPSLRVAVIRLPTFGTDVISVQGQTDAILVRDRTNRVNFHPFSGELVNVQLAQDLSLARRWVDTADPLHFGDFGGLLTKLIWLVFGLALNALILSGAWLYLRRVRRLEDRREAARVLSGVPNEPPSPTGALLHG